MKRLDKKIGECHAGMQLANPVINCWGTVLFAAGEHITTEVKEALYEMGMYQVEVLVPDQPQTMEVTCQ